MMYLGKNAVGLATRRSANGILMSTLTPNADSKNITFPVVAKPYGVMVMTNDRSINTNSTTVICVYTGWTEYNGGQYAQGRVLCVLANGGEDHWQISSGNTYFQYNSANNTFYIEIPANTPGVFRNDREYILYYYTYPLDNSVEEVTPNA